MFLEMKHAKRAGEGWAVLLLLFSCRPIITRVRIEAISFMFSKKSKFSGSEYSMKGGESGYIFNCHHQFWSKVLFSPQMFLVNIGKCT
jgi:hypothetical protein